MKKFKPGWFPKAKVKWLASDRVLPFRIDSMNRYLKRTMPFQSTLDDIKKLGEKK